MAQRAFVLPGEYEEVRKQHEEARKRAGATTVSQYLAQRRRESEQRSPSKGPPLAEVLLRHFREDRVQKGDQASLSPEARAIIEAAGLEIPT